MAFLESEGLEEGLIMKAERPKRKSVSVEKVTNGFIVSSHTSNMFGEKKAIAKTKTEANKMASKFLGSKA